MNDSRCERHPREPRKQHSAASTARWRELYNNARWLNLSRRIRQRDPICCICGKKPSAETDHIVPVAAGGEMWDERNLQGLCHSCHSRKTAREDGGFGRTAVREIFKGGRTVGELRMSE